MGLIIKDHIKKFIKGYPTVSDKYNVSGAVLSGNAPVEFGDLVGFADTKGYFKKLTAVTKVEDIAGIVVATNVKLNLEWPEGKVQTLPGEPFNLLIDGFIAVELDAKAVEANVLANKPVYVTPTATFTTEVNDGAAQNPVANFKLPNAVFTGEVEEDGDKLIAEIYIK